jgi:DNA polymerase I
MTEREGADKLGALFLLDGNNMAYRAFYALPESITTSAGLPANALYGFCSMLIKILSDYRPSGVIVAWDSRGKTFRHADFEEYKAGRKPMPDSLSEQWPYFKEFCEAFGFVNLALPGYEADDILATLAREAEKERRETVIVTGDRDALQLAGPCVTIMSNTRGVTDVKMYDAAAVEARFGVPPRLIPDFIGLKGDSSDNIPGVPGIGEKTAAELLARFGSLEEVLAHVHELSGVKRRQLLEENRDIAVLSKKLATAVVDVPIDIHAAELLPHELRRERLEELFARFEFNSLLDRIRLLPASPEKEDEPVVGPELAVAARASSDADGWSPVLDWGRPVAMVASPSCLWMAQSGPGGDPEDCAAMVTLVLSVDDISRIGPLPAGTRAVCHDFKSSPLLADILEQTTHDTYIAAYLLAPGRREYELNDLVRAHGVVSPRCADPAQAQAASLLALGSHQERLLRQQGMWELFQEIELPLTRVLIDMERQGIALDCYGLGEMAGKVQDQLEGLEAGIYELAGEEFNLGSPQQLGRILFDRLELPRQRKTKTGYSTDAKTLEALKDAHPIVSLILSHRELSKLMSTYLLALPQAVDQSTGRLHTTFNQTVAATGRLSSSDPNLQNIPVRTEMGSQIREYFIADSDNVLVVADYSQIELRIMAHLSGEPALAEAFRRGEDIHTRTAAEVFGVSEDEVDTQHRRYAKAVNFGIMYGISAFGLSQNLGIGREEAGEYIQKYFERLPRVKEFIENTIDTAKREGYVATLFGRRRPIPELSSGDYQQRSLGERLAVNSVIQGTAADIIKVAMINCHRRLATDFPGAHLVLQVHDELVFECPEHLAEAVKEAMVCEMVGAFPMDPPLGVDVGIGADWLAAK